MSVDVFYSEVSGRLVWSHGKAKGADVGHPRSTQTVQGRQLRDKSLLLYFFHAILKGTYFFKVTMSRC